VTFSTKYLAEAILLLGIAWAVIRWIYRSLVEIAGGSPESEGHRFLESMWRGVRRRREQTVWERAASRETAATLPHDPRYVKEHRALEVAYRELRADGPVAERAASMSDAERKAIYDDLVRQLDAGGVSEAERAFALAVALQRLGLKGGKAGIEVAKVQRR
jgi:hypothetical protein